MAKVNKTALHDFVTGEFVKEEHLDQNFEVLRVAINDTDARVDALTQNVSQVENHADSLQISLNNLTASHNNLSQQITNLQLQYTYLESIKADRTYVEQLLADVQAGQLVPGTVRTEHIADGSITAAKVDGVSVLTAQQVDQRISQIPHMLNTFTQRQVFAGGIQDGDSNTDVSLINSVQHQVHTRSTVLTYTSGRLTQVEERDGSAVVKTTTLNYDASGRLSSAVETAGGVSITITFNYDDSGNLISVTRS